MPIFLSHSAKIPSNNTAVLVEMINFMHLSTTEAISVEERVCLLATVLLYHRHQKIIKQVEYEIARRF